MEPGKLNKYILTIVVLVLILPMVFIGGVVLGGSVQGGIKLTADSLSSWISALATAAIAVLTFILAKETWYLREAQNRQLAELQQDAIKPFIDFSLVHCKANFHLIEVRIANYGRGIARDVKFKLVDVAGGVAEIGVNPIVDGIFSLGAVSNGISNLGIGQIYKSFAFGFLDVIGKMGEKPAFGTRFAIEVTCFDVRGHEYKNVVLLDMSSFSGTIEIGGGDPLYKISSNLEKIVNWMSSLTRGSSQRISVDSYNNADRVREKKAIEARYKDVLARQKGKDSGKD